MGASQTKTNLRWSVFVFAFLCVFSTAFFVAADESNTAAIGNYFDDTDRDGLANDEEKIYGTDPEVADTDGDSYSDGVEIQGGFDPLKPAPGDRIVAEESTEIPDASAKEGEVNMTAVASQGLMDMLAEKGESEEVTSEDLNTVMADVLAVSQEEIILPEVNTDNIKIKELSNKLSDEEKTIQNKQDVVEYLTLVSYILISNAPVQIKDTKSLENFAINTGQQMIGGLATGNYAFLDTIEERGKKALEEVSSVEVPESMLDTHVKTIKMLTFASNLKQTVKSTVSAEDPLGQMYMFSKVQGFLMSLDGFIQETSEKLSDFGIEEIPLDI